MKNRVSERTERKLPLLVYSENGHNDHDWAHQSQELLPGFLLGCRVPRLWAILSLSQAISKNLDRKWSSSMGCQPYRQRPSIPCYDAEHSQTFTSLLLLQREGETGEIFHLLIQSKMATMPNPEIRASPGLLLWCRGPILCSLPRSPVDGAARTRPGTQTE